MEKTPSTMTTPMMMMMMMKDDSVQKEMEERNLRPRLCYLTKGERGYGFHLHGERSSGAQFIRRIEAGSPAELAGLRSGDRVVEVNGKNVEKESHQEVSTAALTLISAEVYRFSFFSSPSSPCFFLSFLHHHLSSLLVFFYFSILFSLYRSLDFFSSLLFLFYSSPVIFSSSLFFIYLLFFFSSEML